MLFRSWEDPKGDYAPLEASVAPKSVSRGFSMMPTGDEPAQPTDAVTTNPGQAVLSGDVIGESLATWQRLDAELGDSPAPTISCAALVRIDFAAAGTLLNWVTDHHGRGRSVKFIDAHRLIAAFFDVIGIGDHASVEIRKD